MKVGGVVGYCDGIVTNCYNTGEVHAGQNIVGGVTGGNSGTVTNCYNTGYVHGRSRMGGVVGDNIGTVKNCYYDKSICPIGAVDCSDDDSNSVLGLTTAQMTGENALSNMVFFNDENSISPWITAEDIVTDEKTYWRLPYSLEEKVSDRKTYWCYPHLRGFDYDTDKSNANWPAKIEVSVIWDTANSYTYTYNGTIQGPKVEKVIVGDVSAPDESIVSYYKRKPEPESWDEGYSAYSAITTSRPGTYMMAIAFDDSEETVTKYFSILDKDLYTVTYDDGSTEGCINAGAHTAVVTFEVYKDETGEEKKRSVTESFTIKPAELTLTAKSGTETYDGKEKSVSGFTCSVQGKTVQGLEFTDVSASGKGTVPGKYDVTFEGVTKNTTEDKT
ncbi:MAG: hypothetical protein J6Y20_10370, partial [Lachnospiraceae bacterium]|nr:hypothetical protein [Lachnospiraceae bacterium]